MELELLKLYLKDTVITDKVLSSLGYSKDDISTLLKNNSLLIKTSKGLFKKEEYELSNEYIFLIIDNLIDSKKLDEIKEILKCCYDKNIKNYNIILRLILINLTEKNYKILPLIDDLKIFNSNLANFILLLLNNIINLPPNYIEKINVLTFNDIKFDEVSYLNNICLLCLEYNYKEAFSIFQSEIEEEKTPIINRIIRTLIFHCKEKQTIFNNTIYKLIKDGNYLKIINLLEEESNKRILSSKEMKIKHLCQKIVNANKTFNIANIEIIDDKDEEIAILNNVLKNIINDINSIKDKIYDALDKDNILDYLEKINALKYEKIVRLLLEYNKNYAILFLIGLTKKRNNFDYELFLLLWEDSKANNLSYSDLLYQIIIEANKFNPSLESQTLINNYFNGNNKNKSLTLI